MIVNLVKLSVGSEVGSESVESLQAWQEQMRGRYADGLPRHVTRMWPRREAEILNGGSIYWVIKGAIQCRQRIERLERVTGQDGKERCAIVLQPELIRTVLAPKRPFQGWRYLEAKDTPPDLPKNRQQEDALPPELAGALADIGVL